MKPGDMYKSECGEYVCRYLCDVARFDAWTFDGHIHWLDDDRIKTFADEKLDWPALKYAIGGYSAQMTGQKKGSFTLDLLICDPNKIIIPWKGNTVIETRNIVFRRKIPPQHAGALLRRLNMVQVCVRAEARP